MQAPIFHLLGQQLSSNFSCLQTEAAWNPIRTPFCQSKIIVNDSEEIENWDGWRFPSLRRD